MTLLLRRDRPGQQTKPNKEADLWWAVIRQAAFDLLHGHEQLALDAYEFLSQTGIWMLIDNFGMPEDQAVSEIADLVRRYNVRAERNLPVSRVARHGG